MTKIASKLATGLAVLALAAPAFAATTMPTAGTAQVQASQPKKHHRVHRRVAQADQKKAGEKKASTKKAAKKHATPKAETAPAPAPTPSK
jgi:hypothetical protein